MCWLHANNVATLGTQRPQTQRIQLDETRRIVLVVQTAIILEGCNLGIVQRIW